MPHRRKSTRHGRPSNPIWPAPVIPAREPDATADHLAAPPRTTDGPAMRSRLMMGDGGLEPPTSSLSAFAGGGYVGRARARWSQSTCRSAGRGQSGATADAGGGAGDVPVSYLAERELMAGAINRPGCGHCQ